jgi:hypothetical protein
LLCGREPLDALAPFACLDNPHLARVGSQLARGQLRPILTTWYRRRSYLGEGGRARLTLDEHTQFVGGKPFGFVGQKAAPTHVLASGPAWILEVKCLGAIPGWLLDAVAGCEASSFSKYRWGVQALQQTRRAA